MDQIRHWSHQHFLLLRKDHKMDNEQLTCGICDRHIENHSHHYVCDSCKFYIHKRCPELPRQISPSFQCSSFHSDSHGPLTLYAHRRFYYCHSCHQEFRNSPCFECNQCDFYMDVECALMPFPRISFMDVEYDWMPFPLISYMDVECALTPFPRISTWRRIASFTHQHLMQLVEFNDDVDVEIECFGCHSRSSSSNRVYGCTECKHFLHESCANLPRTIQYPPHLTHGNLTLRVRHEWFTCKLCKKEDNRTLIFDCQQCNFRLCATCGMTVKGTIRYEYHEHPLWFWDNPGADDKLDSCNGYDAYCKKQFLTNSTELRAIQDSPIFKCLNCDFKLHLMCGPLPSSIKYEYHLHPLLLKDSLIEDDCDEYCCDICESKRDPRIRVYYCEGCKYVAHVHCVVSEVKNALKEDHGDIKRLKSIGGDLWQLPPEIDIAGMEELLAKSSTTFQDLLKELNADELWWFKVDFDWDTSSHDQDNVKGQQEEEVKSQSISSTDSFDLRDEFIDELLKFSYFTENDFKDFSYSIERNFYIRKLKINSSYLALKTIEVKGYKIPFTLARVLEALLHQHEHILGKPKSSISTTLKSIALSFVCEVMKQMHSTSVLDVTKDQLEDWYFYLEFAYYRAKFDVQFLKDPLQKITRAFFGFQLSKLETHVPTALSNKIKKLSSQKDVQQGKLDECLQFQNSPKLKIVMECLAEAAELKWKIAGKV